MKTRLMIRLDALLGIPLCGLANLLSWPWRLWRSPVSVRPEETRRILVIKFLGMGSVLLASPVLQRLRKAFPDARIDFLTFGMNGDIVRRLPGVDRVLAVNEASPWTLFASVPGLLWRLRQQRYDVVIDLEFYSRLSCLVSWGSGARQRIGFFVRGRWRGSLLTNTVFFNATLPFSQAVAALLHPLGLAVSADDEPIRPEIGEVEKKEADQRLGDMGVLGEGTLVVVNVNASDLCDERRWPEERFAEFVSRFPAEVAGVDQLVFIGLEGEKETVSKVLTHIDPSVRPVCLDLAGRTTIVELIALLERAALMVSNDGGPLHLAAALGLPTVSFYGPETPALYGPVGKNHLVYYSRHWCSPCLSVYNGKIAWCDGENECMRAITVEEVLQGTKVFCREKVGLAPPRNRRAKMPDSGRQESRAEDVV